MTEQQNQTWLQRLKDESWEAELLVAAISIYSTFQLFGFVEWVTDIFISILPQSFYNAAYFVVYSALLAISILSSMFIIHFMLRAYWVGLVGLNSVFDDYEVDDSRSSKLYLEKLIMALPKLNDSVNKADRLCSVIFSAAFALLMAYGWIFFSTALSLLLANVLVEFLPIYIILLPIYIIGGLVVLQMVISLVCNMPRNKDKEELQTLYFKLSMMTSLLSFGPLYKAIMQISALFSTNFKKDKALVKLVIFFICCGFAMSAVRIIPTNILYLIKPTAYNNPTKAEPRYYFDQSENETFLVSPQLQSDIISSPTLEIFVPVFSSERRLYDDRCEALSTLEDPSRLEKREARLVCLKEFHSVTINGTKVDFELIQSGHVYTQQYGAKLFVKLSDSMESGLYKVEVSKLIYEEPQVSTVPFYYQVRK
ncbi:hypothetical protein [Glaciecola sp. 1036]|uniref:hypothetical protein n=1 Tax=Alteromonadaceae TaxID=72275 RepID=UPI003D03F837